MRNLVPTYGSGKLPKLELEELAKSNSNSFIRVLKPQFFDEDLQQDTPEFYSASVNHFRQLVENQIIIPVQEAIFIYEQTQIILSHGKSFQKKLRGFIVGVSAEDYFNGKVKKHEKIIIDRKLRLVQHILKLNALAEPVLLSQKLPYALLDILNSQYLEQPLTQTTDALGFVHKLWPVAAEFESLVMEQLANIGSLYIADGHHRVESAAQYLMAEPRKSKSGIISLIMDRDELLIKSFHRVISGVGNKDIRRFLELRSLHFETISDDLISDLELKPNHTLIISSTENFHVQLPSSAIELNAADSLEVSKIDSELIKPLFGIQDPSHDPRISFVRGDIALCTMKQQIQIGEIDCVFVLPANTFEQVVNIADQNLIMPPKSTWIEPKMLSGFITQVF